jgi:hypothetical protein
MYNLKEYNLIGKIGSFNLQLLGSNPSTLDRNKRIRAG